MTVHRALRLLAGTMILISLILTWTVSIHFVWLTAFVGLNLVQSAFTHWCPAISILRKLGLAEQPCA